MIKRNGDYKSFESYKIKDAIEKSFESVCIPFDESIFNSVISSIEIKDTWAVEEIQDMIEKHCLKEYFTVMRSFMLYRHTRKLQREHIAGLNDDTTYVDSTQTIEEYISQNRLEN